MAAAVAKSQKEKLRRSGSAPLAPPRATAASSARAARNTNNRNIMNPIDNRSTARSPPSPIKKMQKEEFEEPPIQESTEIEEFHENIFSNNENIKEPETFNMAGRDSIDTIEEASEENATDTQPETEPEVIEDTTEPVITENTDPEIAEKSDPDVADNTIPDTAPKTPTNNVDRNVKTIPKSNPQSRPVTPSRRASTPNQRPTTPQRPVTPQRPITPKCASALDQTGTPAERTAPNTRIHTPKSEQQRPNSHNKPMTPHVPTAANRAKFRSEPGTQGDDIDIKDVFQKKQQMFHSMKKELDLKQQAILQVFDSLQSIRKRMEKDGVPGASDAAVQDLVLFNVADWANEEVAQLYHNAVTYTNPDGAIEIVKTLAHYDENSLADLDEKVTNVPNRFADLCLQVFTARQEIIDWVKEELMVNQPKMDGQDSALVNQEMRSGDAVDRIARYNSQGLEFCDALRELKNFSDNVVETVKQLSRHAIQERSTLVSVGESLVRETERLRSEIKSHTTALSEIQKDRINEEEQSAKTSPSKDKVAMAEVQLRQARNRITKMDRQLKEAEASISTLTSTVKTMEEQNRQREVQLEAKARKWRDMVKTGDFNTNQLTQKNKELQAELQQLKSQMTTITEQHKHSTKENLIEIKQLRTALEETRIASRTEKEWNEEAEKKISESQNIIDELTEKVRQLENARQHPELPTEKEMNLWSELVATKDTLRSVEEEIAACKREKIRFLETLTKMTKSDDKIGLQQKLAAELVTKEEIINNMQVQVRELAKNMKLNEQKVIQYEHFVKQLQSQSANTAQDDYNGGQLATKELQQEAMNLRMSLLDAAHRNEELSEMLLKKEQQIEQQDKTSRAQARVIKVREELINMLKNKETEQARELLALQQDLQHRMKVVEEVNHQIAAKADEIQELFMTLEGKQQQIHRLEKIVLALEEQQRRAQSQRTRHEEKIATLEHALAVSGRHERKYLFF